MNKKITLASITLLLILVLSFAFVACGKLNTSDNNFSMPEMSNLNDLYEAISDGTFKFSSATLKILEYNDENKLTTESTMYFTEDKEYTFSSVDMFGTGAKTNVKMYVLPDLTEKYQYVLMNNFMTNGWSYSKLPLEFEKFDGHNFATLALLSYMMDSELDFKEIPLTIENNSIIFNIENQKYTLFDFNNTSVVLPDELKDYKSKC